MRGIRPFTATALVLGLLFLYLPILWVVLLSFNESRLLTRFEGFSLRWYQALFSDPPCSPRSAVACSSRSPQG